MVSRQSVTLAVKELNAIISKIQKKYRYTMSFSEDLMVGISRKPLKPVMLVFCASVAASILCMLLILISHLVATFAKHHCFFCNLSVFFSYREVVALSQALWSPCFNKQCRLTWSSLFDRVPIYQYPK